MKELITNKDYEGIRKALSQDPSLANEGIPFDETNTTKAHPLHRICDGVFSHSYADEEAVEMAKIFLEYGANVNGNGPTEKMDTPLTAAASLHAAKTGILYIENGADIHHAGCHGGTALHWAAWTGNDQLVNRLLAEGAAINKRCIDFMGTPLLWAIHGFKHGGPENRGNQLECARLLIAAGADKTIPNIDGDTPFQFLNEEDAEWAKLLK